MSARVRPVGTAIFCARPRRATSRARSGVPARRPAATRPAPARKERVVSFPARVVRATSPAKERTRAVRANVRTERAPAGQGASASFRAWTTTARCSATARVECAARRGDRAPSIAAPSENPSLARAAHGSSAASGVRPRRRRRRLERDAGNEASRIARIGAVASAGSEPRRGVGGRPTLQARGRPARAGVFFGSPVRL